MINGIIICEQDKSDFNQFYSQTNIFLCLELQHLSILQTKIEYLGPIILFILVL